MSPSLLDHPPASLWI